MDEIRIKREFMPWECPTTAKMGKMDPQDGKAKRISIVIDGEVVSEGMFVLYKMDKAYDSSTVAYGDRASATYTFRECVMIGKTPGVPR